MYVYTLLNGYAYVGGRTFLIVNNSSLMKLAQMYEFTAESPQEKKQLVFYTYTPVIDGTTLICVLSIHLCYVIDGKRLLREQ